MNVQNARPQDNGNNTNTEGKREPFSINVEAEPFNGISTTKFVTSSDLCKVAADIFKSVFDDCEGVTFDIIGNLPTLSVVFNHGIYESGSRLGITREASVDANASIVQRLRSRDRLLANGDRYFATEDAKDVFTDLLSFQVFNNGKPNWGKVVNEFSENTQQRFYGYGQNPQYTKIGYIDLAKFVSLVWGKSDNDGNSVDYIVSIVHALSNGVPGMPPSNYMLSVTQISAKELQATYEKLGFGSFSNIIR